jgi:hypothetical protein
MDSGGIRRGERKHATQRAAQPFFSSVLNEGIFKGCQTENKSKGHQVIWQQLQTAPTRKLFTTDDISFSRRSLLYCG